MAVEDSKTMIKIAFKPEFVRQIYNNYMLSIIRPDIKRGLFTDEDFINYQYHTYDENYGLTFGEHMVYKILDSMEFYSPIPMDINREGDARDMRYNFYHIYCDKVIPMLLGEIPRSDMPTMSEIGLEGSASVFEVLVAFATRIEDDILHDDTKGYRAAKWFRVMMDNLGLSQYFNKKKMTQEDCDSVRMTINIMLDQSYSPSGTDGALFPNDRFSDKIRDCRDVELWYQMSIWFSMHPEITQ